MSKIVVRDVNCPVFRALEVIGEKWTILILRDLFLDGPKKYQDLFLSLDGISPNILADRLQKLVSQKIVSKKAYQNHPPRYVYKLTKKGLSLEGVLGELRDWGLKNTSLS